MSVPEIIVVDASVSVKWINRSEANADKASLIWQDYEKGSVSFLLPQFWDYEVVNCINKALARGELSPEEGQEAVNLLLSVQASKLSMPSARESYQLARQYQRSVYDSFYLASAEQTGCKFWTADEKLYNAVKAKLQFVKWLGDYMSH